MLYNVCSCAPPTSRIVYAQYANGHRTLHVLVRFVLHETLGLFVIHVLNSLFLLYSVSSTPLSFLVKTRAKFVVCHGTVSLQKVLTEILQFKLLQYRKHKS